MLSLISAILRRKKLVVLVTIAGFVVSSAVSLVLPKRYVSTAVFMPAGLEREITGLESFFKNLGEIGETAASIVRANKNYVVDRFIRSRRMSGILDARFDLKRAYGVETAEEVQARLSRRTSVLLRDEGTIVMSVEDRSPQRAAAMLETCLHALDSLLADFAIESAKERVVFLEQEIERRERALERSDAAIEAFLRQYGLFDMEQQARATLAIVTDLSARLSLLDVQRKLLELSLKPGSLEIKRTDAEWEKLRTQLIALRDGAKEEAALFPPLKDLPGIGARYLELINERRMEEFVLAYLRIQHEDARVSAHSTMSTLRILDPPAVPEKRTWPRRTQIVLVSTMAVFFWTSLAVLVDDRRRLAGSPGAAGPGRGGGLGTGPAGSAGDAA